MKALKTIYPLLIAALVLARCNCSPTVAGNGSQTPNSVVGILYQPDGKTPAAGVHVHIRPQKTLADTTGAGLTKRLAVLAAIDSVTTNGAGQYTFDTTLDTGTYVIEAASGNNAVLIDSVTVKNKAVTDTVAPDTLKPAGALKGIIYLSEGGDPRKVFVLAFGIDRFAKVNTDGSFKFSGLAEAKYDLRLISGLDNYGVLDTTAIPVRSADTTNLDTIRLPFTGIPTPKNVRISYDTLKQIVTLTWNKADTALVKSFNVYRRNVDSNTVAVRINTSPMVDTVYRDSTGVQGTIYEYMVAAVNKSTTEGTKSAGDSVKVVSAYSLSVAIGNGTGIGPGKFASLQDIIIDSKGRLFAADAGTAQGQNKTWVFDTSGILIDSIGADSGAGQVNRIRKLGLKGDSLLDVAQGNKAQVFDAQGNFVGLIGATGTGDSIFTSDELLGITFANSFYYIIDNRVIKTFSESLVFAKKFGGMGNGPGLIGPSETPANIGFDSVGNIIVAVGVGSNPGRILKYTPDGVYMSEFPIAHEILDFKVQKSLLYFVVNDPSGQKGVLVLNQDGSVYAKIVTDFYPNCIAITTGCSIFVGSEDGKIRKYVKN